MQPGQFRQFGGLVCTSAAGGFLIDFLQCHDVGC
jgi:hypothetical protein